MPLTISEIDMPLPPMLAQDCFAKDCALTRKPGRAELAQQQEFFFEVSEADPDSLREAMSKLGPPAGARQGGLQEG
jgi:hypothetical protein